MLAGCKEFNTVSICNSMIRHRVIRRRLLEFQEKWTCALARPVGRRPRDFCDVDREAASHTGSPAASRRSTRYRSFAAVVLDRRHCLYERNCNPDRRAGRRRARNYLTAASLVSGNEVSRASWEGLSTITVSKSVSMVAVMTGSAGNSLEGSY